MRSDSHSRAKRCIRSAIESELLEGNADCRIHSGNGCPHLLWAQAALPKRDYLWGGPPRSAADALVGLFPVDEIRLGASF